MLNDSGRLVRFRFSLLSSALVAVVLTSCSGSNEDGALNPPGSVAGVERFTAPAARSQREINGLNTYRAQAFSVLATTSSAVNHSNILYTAAYRHSVFLNTVNSASFNPATLRGVPGTTVTSSSTTDALRNEPTITGVMYPAYATAARPWNRVNAVTGGPDLLKQLMGEGIKEYYLFDGDIPKDSASTGGGSGGAGGAGSSEGEHFRGFPRADTSILIDNLWYSRKGRLALLRPNLAAIGVGQPDDEQSGVVVSPPWPFLDGRFLGAVTCAYARPEQTLLSVWPKDGSTGIRHTGLDTDLAEIVNAPDGATVDDIVPHSYAGPPISVTLPINVPFLLNPTNPVGGVTVGFRKLEKDPQTDAAQAPPASFTARHILAMVALPSGATEVVFSAVNQATDSRYQFSVVGSTVTTTTGTSLQNDSLRFGDLILIPTGPLEPSSWYEVAVSLRSTAPAPWDNFPGTQEERLENPVTGPRPGWTNDGYYQFRFKTRN